MSHPNNGPTLLFTPYAWRKLVFFRDQSSNEVGALGISTKRNPLTVIDLVLPKQQVTGASVQFDMDDVADIYADLDSRGFSMDEYARIWIHTHPGSSPNPSGTDENTFADNYKRADWAVMFILAQGGQAFSRLRLNKPMPVSVNTGVGIDWSHPFEASQEEKWSQAYKQAVSVYKPIVITLPKKSAVAVLEDRNQHRKSSHKLRPEEDLEQLGDDFWWDDEIDDSPMDPVDEMAYEQYLASIREDGSKE